ncbi:MAG: hypothetical protein KGJ52_08860, partial [Gammaproteobacteria bacterium]|nr:hypothetical protein [Gammaproteobacteria bacterium]
MHNTLRKRLHPKDSGNWGSISELSREGRKIGAIQRESAGSSQRITIDPTASVRHIVHSCSTSQSTVACRQQRESWFQSGLATFGSGAFVHTGGFNEQEANPV